MTDPLAVTVIIAADPPSRLDKALARDVPDSASLSRSRLTRLIGAGAVRRGAQVLSDPKMRVAEGDEITVLIDPPAEIETRPENIPLEILFEDDDLIVVNKPVGMVVHPAPGTPGGTLVNALLHHFGDNLSGVGGAKRPGIVHRIDKDTSGLLVVAKSDRAHHGLPPSSKRIRSIAAMLPSFTAFLTPGIRGCAVLQGSGSKPEEFCV